MTIRASSLLVLFLCGPAVAGEYRGKDLSVWVPDGATEVRAALVHRHYGAGNQLYKRSAWREFAKTEHLAMALLIPSSGKRKKDPVSLEQGRRDVERLYAGLAKAAEELRIPQLAAAPFIPTGVSRGSANGIAMVYAAPDRAVAAIGYRGESVIGSEQFGRDACMKVPVLYVLASNDPKRNARVFTHVRDTMRGRLGAPWTLIVQPDTRHNSVGDDDFVLPWLAAVLQTRLRGPTSDLSEVDWDASGWADGQLAGADGATARLHSPRVIAPAQREPLPARSHVNWLPTPELAEQWVNYHSGKRRK